MRRALVLALALGCVLAAVHTACAQTSAEDYPQHTVTFLCPFPAGGGTDMLTRLLAQELQEKLKRPVTVDNRPGAGTIVAAQAAARAAPDGHTIFLAPVTTARHGPERAQVPALRHCERFRSHRPRRIVAVRVDCQSQGAGPHARGADRLHQEQRRQTQLCLLRRRDAAPSF